MGRGGLLTELMQTAKVDCSQFWLSWDVKGGWGEGGGHMYHVLYHVYSKVTDIGLRLDFFACKLHVKS